MVTIISYDSIMPLLKCANRLLLTKKARFVNKRFFIDISVNNVFLCLVARLHRIELRVSPSLLRFPPTQNILVSRCFHDNFISIVYPLGHPESSETYDFFTIGS